jgi:hypothetical protein
MPNKVESHQLKRKSAKAQLGSFDFIAFGDGDGARIWAA